ncbi:MAG: hypothetical protein IPQ07_40090 [Myxococcales bacterium]|nr:hypothetical protein [Myxococcales bacterium]
MPEIVAKRSEDEKRERLLADGREEVLAAFRDAANVCERQGWAEGAEVVRRVTEIIAGSAFGGAAAATCREPVPVVGDGFALPLPWAVADGSLIVAEWAYLPGRLSRRSPESVVYCALARGRRGECRLLRQFFVYSPGGGSTGWECEEIEFHKAWLDGARMRAVTDLCAGIEHFASREAAARRPRRAAPVGDSPAERLAALRAWRAAAEAELASLEQLERALERGEGNA